MYIQVIETIKKYLNEVNTHSDFDAVSLYPSAMSRLYYSSNGQHLDKIFGHPIKIFWPRVNIAKFYNIIKINIYSIYNIFNSIF